MKRLMKGKPGLRRRLRQPSLATMVSQMLIEARVQKGVTQVALAKKMRTKQSSIARAESGRQLPNLSFLEEMARAYNARLVPPRFSFLKPNWYEDVFPFAELQMYEETRLNRSASNSESAFTAALIDELKSPLALNIGLQTRQAMAASK